MVAMIFVAYLNSLGILESASESDSWPPKSILLLKSDTGETSSHSSELMWAYEMQSTSSHGTLFGNQVEENSVEINYLFQTQTNLD